MKTKPIFLILILAIVTAAAMALAQQMAGDSHRPLPALVSPKGPLAGSVSLVQHKVLKQSDGTVAVGVTLTAAPQASDTDRIRRPVSLTVVLDRSGSMQGEKLSYALGALKRLLLDLSDQDRLALVSYANDAIVHSGLRPMTPQNRQEMANIIDAIQAGGGTNLGAGLQAAMGLMSQIKDAVTLRHMLVISDGLVNQGITDPGSLGKMVAAAGRQGISVGTVGVGADFNEQLMTLLADLGQGRYYYLENPVAFAGLFTKEYRYLGLVTATDVVLEIETGAQVTLVDAAGYPMTHKSGTIQVRPGNIKAGETRTLYLTFKVPTHKIGRLSLGQMQMHYRHGDHTYRSAIGKELTLACVADPAAVVSSIEKSGWTEKVLKNDYNLLKKEVAQDIRDGDEARARRRIDGYRQKQSELNAVIGSQEVKANLDNELKVLETQVKDTFSGEAAQVEQKQKAMSKSLHYDSYKGQRAVK